MRVPSIFLWRNQRMPLFEYEEIDQLTKEDLPVYKIPKSIQQTIDITAIAKNGVFCHTPKKRKRG